MESSPQATHSSRAERASGRILAIDYGRKRVGLAISDELGLMAQPLATIVRTNRRNDLRRLRLLAREHQVRCVVIGLPLHLDGRASEMALEVKRFAARLTKELGLPVELADERLSSWEAAQTTSSKRPPRTGKKSGNRVAGKAATRDDVAAAIILRDYLAEHQPRRSSRRTSVKS
jgi:putative Holliday junction resolvase